jgi:hypothetical protein
MKDRALRRHQELKVRKKSQKTFINCIPNAELTEMESMENHIEKLRKACVLSHFDKHNRKATKKTIQEKKHDLTMKEQILFN